MKRLFQFLVVPFLLGVAFICATPQSASAGSRSNASSQLNDFVFHQSSLVDKGFRYDLYYIDLDVMRQKDSDMEALFNRAHASRDLKLE